MAVSYTIDNLVARIRRTTQLSDDNLKLSTSDIMEIADESIQSRLWPTLRSTIEEYATTHAYVTFDSTNPIQASSARLPTRASGSTIVAVYQVLSTGGVRPVTRIDISECQRFGDPMYGDQTEGPNPLYYALTGDYIKIVPPASEDVTLRVLYERRPSRLCLLADAAEIVSWNDDAEFTVVSYPASWTSGTHLDIVKAAQQATDPITDDAIFDGTVGPLVIDLSFDEASVPKIAVLNTVSAGDYLCEAGTTCVFPLPDIWYPVCVMAAASDVLMQAGYVDESGALMPAVERMVAQAQNHSSSRVRKQPKAIFDRDSPLRTGGRTFGGWGWNGGGNP